LAERVGFGPSSIEMHRIIHTFRPKRNNSTDRMRRYWNKTG
jgi:hypothetical protein